jgi:hypothetical protein
MLGISSVAEEMLASHEGLCFVEFSISVFYILQS